MSRSSSKCLLSIAVLTTYIGIGSADAATVFTDRDMFNSSFNRTLVAETFDNDIATADSITFASGIDSTKSTSGIPPTLNRVSGGDFDGFLVRDDFRNITFDLPTPAFGFGGDFSGGGTALNSLFITANFAGGGSFRTDIADALTGNSGFFALSAKHAFSSLIFSTSTGIPTGGTPAGGQTFSVDDVVVAPVPLPAGLALMLGALGFSGAALKLSRRRKAQGSA